MRLKILLLVVALASLVGGMVHAFAGVRTVESAAYYFEDTATGSRTEVVITAGDQTSVRVLDNGGGGTKHTVEIPAFGVSSGPLGDGDVFNTPALTTPGTYAFFCKPHRNRGHEITLVVKPAATTTTTTSTTTTTTTTTSTTTQAPGTTTTTTTAPGTTTSTTQAPGTTSTTQAPGATTSTTQEPGTTTTTSTAPGSTPTPPAGGSTSTTIAGASTTIGDTAVANPSDTTANAGEPLASVSSDATAASGELLPVGVVESEDTTRWLRSIYAGLAALIPIALLAALVGRHRRDGEDADTG